jgi:hypothetical protein
MILVTVVINVSGGMLTFAVVTMIIAEVMRIFADVGAKAALATPMLHRPPALLPLQDHADQVIRVEMGSVVVPMGIVAPTAATVV